MAIRGCIDHRSSCHTAWEAWASYRGRGIEWAMTSVHSACTIDHGRDAPSVGRMGVGEAERGEGERVGG